MDILAHALWAGAGIHLARRRIAATRPMVAAGVAMAVLPDVVQALPVLGWALLGDGSLAALVAYVFAAPGSEPAMPAMVGWLSHHLHCVTHSAVVAGAVTLLARPLWRTAGAALLGWWSHIVIDVFTHSAEFYAVPVFYPITMRGFDGIAWNEPWFMAANYAALGLMGLWLLLRGRLREGG